MLLVAGQSVLTGRLDVPEVRGGGVVVDGATIVAVGPLVELRATYPDATEFGGPDCVVMPGLVSAHQHGAGVTSTQLGCVDRPFEQWLLAMFGLVPLDVRLDTRFHALRLLENGITTTLHSHYTRDPDHYHDEVDRILAGYGDVGIRVAFAPCFLDINLLTYGEDNVFRASLPSDLATASAAVNGGGIRGDAYIPFVESLTRSVERDLVSVLFGPVAPQWCDPGTLQAIGAAVQDGVAGVHTHLLESAAQRAYLDRSLGRSVVTVLDEWGLLGPTTSVAHGVHLTRAEMDLLALRETTVVTNPGCNLRLGNGRVPLVDLLAAGVNVAIGTDDMTLGDDDDLLAEVRLMRALARPSGGWLDAAWCIYAATGAGARAIGDPRIGALAPGMQADIVVLDTRRLTEPFTDQASSMLEVVVTRARGDDVSTVFVAGEVVLDDRRHRSIDRESLVGALHEIATAQAADPARQQHARAMTRLADAYAARFVAAGGGS